MKFNLEIDFDDLFDECGETYTDVIKAELEHEFKLAVRREMKRNSDFEKAIEEMVTEVTKGLQKDLSRLIAESLQ